MEKDLKEDEINSAINVIWNQNKKIYLEQATSQKYGKWFLDQKKKNLFHLLSQWSFRLENAKG